MGPMQGVQPAAKVIPTSTDPRMPSGFVVSCFFRSREPALAAVSSSKETPVMNVTYEGTRGRTQGEMKETSPATKAARRETWFTWVSNTGVLRREEGLNRLLESLEVGHSEELLRDPSLAVHHEAGGNFGPAGSAPRGPEVQDHDLAFVVGEPDRLPVQVLKLEIGRLRPDLARVRGNGTSPFRRAFRAAEGEENRGDEDRPSQEGPSRGSDSISPVRNR